MMISIDKLNLWCLLQCMQIFINHHVAANIISIWTACGAQYGILALVVRGGSNECRCMHASWQQRFSSEKIKSIALEFHFILFKFLLCVRARGGDFCMTNSHIKFFINIHQNFGTAMCVCVRVHYFIIIFYRIAAIVIAVARQIRNNHSYFCKFICYHRAPLYEYENFMWTNSLAIAHSTCEIDRSVC